ncbi:sigma factor [Pseudomonas putida]|uniref:Putative RNA polymerase sigma factor n=1 Tax=Pseudomonas putida TaxID=303 RepID=A0A1L7NNJ5_PSEPU|nr:sigma factor [Pseudomonas putida]BAW27050.1 Putative RNA polymerase sigma factor [Pseudomonas putida]
MNTQARANHIPQSAGFVVPDVLPDFPATPRAGLRLSLEQEQAFGFTVFQLTLDQIQALACDREVVAELLSEMEGAFTKENKADKAVALLKVDGQWFRQGSIPGVEFSKLSRERIQLVRQCLDALNSLEGGDRDLFYMEALDSLRKALSLLVPYDAILAKAVNAFKSRCGDLSAACRELVMYVASEMHLSRTTVQRLCEQFWLSNKLPAICFGSNRYVQSIMPAKAKREFRFGVLERQQRIARVALETGVPVIELLASWSAFHRIHQRIDRLSGAFAMINAGLAEKVAREHRFAADFDQVRSAAYQGLTRAISLYAPEKGMKFSTYAVTWIKQTIIRSLIQQELIRLPEGSHKMLGRVRAVYADMPSASDEYVCKAAGISTFELDGLRPYLLGNGAMSMDTLSNSEGDEAGMHSFIADQNNDFVAELEEESEAAYVVGLIRAALSERDFFVLTHRTGLAGAQVIPVAELAQMLDTSPQNISRMEKKVQSKLACIEELKAVWELME